MNRISLYTGIVGMLCLLSCHPVTRYKTPSGLVYTLIPGHGKDTALARLGCTVKLNYIARVRDSVIDETYDKMPIYAQVMPPAYYAYNPLEAIGYGVREGDSIVTIQIVDTMLKKRIFTRLAPYMHPGDEWVTSYRIMKVFRPSKDPRQADSLLQTDKAREHKRADSLQAVLGPQRIQRFLKDRHISVLPRSGDLYIEVLSPGSGPRIDSGNFVSLHYTFTTLSGVVLDGNLDTGFHHPPLMQYAIRSRFMLPMVDSALCHLQKGARAKIYLPTMQATGGKPLGAKGRAYDDLIMDVEVADVQSKAPDTTHIVLQKTQTQIKQIK